MLRVFNSLNQLKGGIKTCLNNQYLFSELKPSSMFFFEIKVNLFNHCQNINNLWNT